MHGSTVAIVRYSRRKCFYFVYFLGGLECDGHSFAYVAHVLPILYRRKCCFVTFSLLYRLQASKQSTHLAFQQKFCKN
jgi:hypothetical protein